MVANSKREADVTNGKISSAREAFIQKYPDWIQQLSQIAESTDPDIPKEKEPILTALDKFLFVACTEIKSDAFKETELLDLFPQELHSFVQKLIDVHLKIFRDFAPLHAMYRENRPKAENIIDQIWQQYVIRFNPLRKIECSSGMTDKDLENLEGALDGFAEYCGVRMLHYDAIVRRIKQETNLPNDLCAYIARKIEKDYQEIRMNYIVSRLEDLKPLWDSSDQR